jgi:hypothetical protein
MSSKREGFEVLHNGSFHPLEIAMAQLLDCGPAQSDDCRRRLKTHHRFERMRLRGLSGARDEFHSEGVASPFLIRMPRRAPTPMPTMIAVGVAKPSEHGQAMSSTAGWHEALVDISCEEIPTDCRCECDAEHDRHEYSGYPVGKLLNGGLVSLSLGDHPDDLRQNRILPDLSRRHLERATDVDGRAEDFVALHLGNRHAFARQQRLVHAGGPVRNRAIDRHFFARPHLQKVADLHLIDGNVQFRPSRITCAVLAPSSISFSMASPAWPRLRSSKWRPSRMSAAMTAPISK